MTAHSKIGAIYMYRWSACPGSVRLSAGIESKSSKYASEGTTAHEHAANFLLGKAIPGLEKELYEAVLQYGYFVRDQVKPGDVLLVEHQFDLSKIHPGCFGTADAVVWQPWPKHLIVIDFKYGAGIPVEVEDNPQLMYYALGALLTCGFSPVTVEMVIVQPRCDHPDGPIRRHTIDAIDLLDFSVDLKDYAVATEQPDAPVVPGDHCQFCPAAQINPKTMETYCPALKDRAQALAKLEFKPGLPYDPQKLKLALDSRDAVKAMLKALDEFAYSEAEAGRTIPGYKLVAKRATRKWRSEGEAAEKLQELVDCESLCDGVEIDIFEPKSLKSPAQIEKLVGRGVIDEFVVAESSGHTLVPEGDRRPPVRPSAKDEFSVVGG